MTETATLGRAWDSGEETATGVFVRRYPPAAPASGAIILYLPFLQGSLVQASNGALIRSDVTPFDFGDAIERLYIGDLDGEPVVTYALDSDTALPEGFQAVGLRSLWGKVSEAEFGVAGYALQLLHYRAHYRYCSRCGEKTVQEAGTWGQKCPACGHSVYPPVSPAVLALIHDGADRILLAQKPGWGKRYSIIAGFVEPGESFEGCVLREAAEEVGVRVIEPKYVGSQPWPFPHQVMVGFTCRWAGGEIIIDETELSDARWFTVDDLPELPATLSLSRQIIDAWIAQRRPTK